MYSHWYLFEVLTFDGLKYDCHGEGDFTLLQSNVTARQIQGRLEHVSGNKAASITKGITIRDEGDSPVVQVSIPFSNTSSGKDMGDGCKLQLFVDGQELPVEKGVRGNDRVKVVHRKNDVWVKFPKTKFSAKIRYFQCYLSICANVPDSDPTIGVLGTATGRIDDDWTLKNGTELPVPDSLSGRLSKPAYDFCTEYCIKKREESMFVYPEENIGLDFDYYQRCDLPYGNTIEQYLQDAPPHVIDTCEGDLQCIVDVMVTGQAGAAELHVSLSEYGDICNPPGGECDESKCCEGDCVDFGGFAGKVCSGDPTVSFGYPSPFGQTQSHFLTTQCAPEYGACLTRPCCKGFECKHYDNGSHLCVPQRDCMPEWTRCESTEDCCDGLTCLDNHRGGRSCRRLPSCATNWDDCSQVSCCNGLSCVDTEDGGRQCKGVPDCWTAENKDCSVAPCCLGLTCVQDQGRSICKYTPETVGRGESCELAPCQSDKNLECVARNGVDAKSMMCQPTCSDVEVFVFNDVNSNGLQDPNEPGIAAVKLEIIQKVFGSGTTRVGNEQTTDNSGKASFTCVPRGKTFHVQVVEAPLGAVPTTSNQGGDDEKDSDLKDTGISEPFKINNEAIWTRTDLGYLMPVDVSLRIFHDKNSNGLQDAGEQPIKSTVRLMDATGTFVPRLVNNNRSTIHDVHHTDPEGLVTIRGVPQKKKFGVQMTSDLDGFVPTRANTGKGDPMENNVDTNRTFYEFIVNNAMAAFKALDLGYILPNTVSVRVWNDVNSNGIQDVQEPGIAGVKLRLVHEKNKTMLEDRGNNGTAHEELTTNADGLVHFTKVAGDVRVTVQVTLAPPGGMPTLHKQGRDSAKDSNLRENGFSDAFKPQDVQPKHTAVDLGYLVPGSVVVRVWDDADGDGIQDETESGIKGVLLQVVNEATKEPLSSQYFTNSDGFVTFQEIPQKTRVQVIVVNAPQGALRTRQNVGGDAEKDSDLGLNNLSDPFFINGTSIVSHIDLGYQMPKSVTVRVWDDNNKNNMQDEGEVGVEGVTLQLVKDKDGSIFMGKCEGKVKALNQVASEMCEVCDVPNNKTLDVTCSNVPSYVQHGSYEGKCLSPEETKPGTLLCSVCDRISKKTFTVPCNTVVEQIANGNARGRCLPTAKCKFEVTTNSSGFATFLNVPKGIDFRVVVVNEPKGAVRASQNKGDEDKDSDLGSDGRTSTFNLANFDGSSFDSVDIGYAMPDSVEVFVFDDINGNGIQETNELGISGVELQLIYANGTVLEYQGDGATSHEIVFTNESGIVIFNRVPVGVHLRVKVLNAPEGSATTILNAGNDDELDSDLRNDGTTVSFNLGSFKGSVFGHIDIGYIMPKSVEVRVWNDINGDGIQDPIEPGIKGVKLRLVDGTTGDWMNNIGGGSNAHEEIVTDADGLTTFRGVPKGKNMWIKVTKPPPGGTRTRHNIGGAEVDSDLGDFLTSDEFNLNSFAGSGVYGSIDLGFIMPKKMIVRVWYDENRNGIQDMGEEGIRNVQLRLVKSSDLKDLSEDESGGTAHYRVMTDDSGRAVFTGVPLGVELRVEVIQGPENMEPTKKNSGFDEHTDSDLNPGGISEPFKIASDMNGFFDSIDLGFMTKPCECKPRVYDNNGFSGFIPKSP